MLRLKNKRISTKNIRNATLATYSPLTRSSINLKEDIIHGDNDKMERHISRKMIKK